MKKLFLLLLFLALVTNCFAEVTAQIIAVDKDDNGNIRVKTQYKIDGVEVVSKYPQQDGKYYWVTRYDVRSFVNMTKAQILGRVKNDIRAFEDNLITREFIKINNDAWITAGQDLVNITDIKTSASMYVDKNSDGIADTEWIIYTNGTKTEQPYTPPIQ